MITGAYNQSATVTLREGTTLYVMLVQLPGGHIAKTAGKGLVETMSALPAHLRSR